MKVLISGAGSRLGQHIVQAMDETVDIRLLDTNRTETARENCEWICGSIVDPDITWRAVRGVDVVIYTGEPEADCPDTGLPRDEQLMDLATRGTHILFKAGVEAGVRRFVYGSTLEVFRGYADSVCVGHMHRPLVTPAIDQMSRYLGELTAREFARDHHVSVTTLRLGDLVLEEEVAGEEPDLMWLDLRDAGHGFRAATQRDTGSSMHWVERYAVFHLCAPIANPKYLSTSGLGFEPQHDFGRGAPS